MDKKDYKSFIDKIEPDKSLENRLGEKIKGRKNKNSIKPFAVTAACLIFLLGISTFRYQQSISSVLDSNESPIKDAPKTIISYKPVSIPKVELPENPNVVGKMMPLIVYKGKVYIHGDTQVNPEIGKKMIGEKLGRTKGSLNEWSKQEEYSVEFASTVGETDVYAVKGYDSSFRIMTYEEYDGQGIASFFECLNGIEVKNGKDLFSKFNIDNNLETVYFESFDSWNNGKQEYKNIQQGETVTNFIEALYNAEPLEAESLTDTIFDNGEENQRFMFLKLKDSTTVRLRLLKDNYVMYNNDMHVVFKVNESAFDALWKSL